MCGIVGLLGGLSPEDLEPRARRMLATLEHRGPDGEGLRTFPQASLALGHKRLAIIDPAGGAQPLESSSGHLVVTFNGCIYNFRELRAELEAQGYRFRTQSDTEVLVHAYEHWGPDCVQRFNGMWAFAIWDTRNQTLFCSRDRLGIKPFYFHWDGETLAFASEIKALLASGLVRARTNPTGLRQYLTFQFCLGPTTLFRDIERLPPGHNLVLRRGASPEIQRYWDVSYSEEGPEDDGPYLEQLRELLEDSVRLRLRSDVPLGAHLSGGLDSSTVTTLARRHLGDAEVKTFTGAFREGEAFDETRHARLVAEEVGTTYLERFFTARHFEDSIRDIVWHMDQPAMGPGVFPQFWISRLAGEHVKVVLGGQGGDEIFMGYARYLVAHLEHTLRGAIYSGSGRDHSIALLQGMAPNLDTLEQYVPMMRGFFAEGLFEKPARRYYRLLDRFLDARKLLAPGFEVDAEATYQEFEDLFETHHTSPLNQIAYLDMKTHLQGLLHVEDRTSMAASLESRVPLLDHRIVEAVARIPISVKVRDGKLKYLFRQLIRDIVPRPILERTDKMGFPVPIADWMRGDLRDLVGDVLLGSACRNRGILDPEAIEKQIDSASPFSRSLWGALCLEIWHQTFVDG